MSLLNDMLRDLSHPAKSGVNTSLEAEVLVLNDAEQRELFSQSSAAKPLSRSLVPSIIVFVLVLAGFIGGRYFFAKPLTAFPVAPLIDIATTATENKTTTNVTSEAAALTENISTSVSNVAEDISITNKATTNEATTNKAISDVINEVIAAPELGERLAALETAVTTLTTVVAETKLQAVKRESLAVDANNNALSEAATDSVSIKEPFVADAFGAETTGAEPVPETPLDKNVTEEIVQDKTLAAPIPAADASLTISPNAGWQDQQFAMQAQKKFRAGQVGLTIIELQDFIASQAAPLESTKLLLDILLEQENVSAVQQALAQAEFLPGVEKRYYAAKIALLTGLDTEAISLLEQSLAEAENHENYRALLAGLYQRNGMNQEAASHYRRLINVFGEKPAYWLGFALAQDALNQAQLAIQAYQRVNQYADLQPQVRTYIEQRLAALQQ